MFNYSTKWNDELDNEVKLGLMAGWKPKRIAESIGKTRMQVHNRIKKLKDIEAKEKKYKKILANSAGIFNEDGSVNYTECLKLGD
jgi:hypothetical protein